MSVIVKLPKLPLAETTVVANLFSPASSSVTVNVPEAVSLPALTLVPSLIVTLPLPLILARLFMLLILPGEPISLDVTFSALLKDKNAPLTPTALIVDTVGRGRVVLPKPTALSKVVYVVDPPKLTPVILVPLALKRLTASPRALSPTPLPV